MFSSLRLYFSPFVKKNEELRLLQIFKPLYLVLSFLGLIPCSLDLPQGNVDCIILHKSAFKHSCSAFLTLLIVYVFFGLHVYEVLTSHEENILADDKMAKANYIIELVTQFTFCNATYFCAFRYKEIYVSILKEITRSWDDLPYVNRGIILGHLRVKVNCGVIGTICLILLTLTAVTYAGSSSLWKRILITMSFNLPEMIQFILVAFYYVFVLMVVALLKNIEDHCRMFMKARRSIKNCSKVELGRIPITLSQMQCVYVKALRVKRQINVVFQAPIMFSLLQCFHTMVSESYDICQGLLYQDNFTTHNLVECSYWVLLQMLKIYALARSGSLLKLEALKIGRTIHNIRSDDEEIKLLVEIQHFSTLMAFQSTEITIFGYFPLEAPLMFNMVAAAAMYLIILVQFAKTH
uniref:Gustatory receptor n=1 Tax=Cydia pomonella TaxID=82600 RepID=A0A0V0J1G5_CYDPO